MTFAADRSPARIDGSPALIGHNQGPAIAREGSWHSFTWRRAHKNAWKAPPIETLRLRCRRAAGLGLTYRQYTSALMDRGVHLQAVIFDLDGTLVRMENGQVQPLPGVLEKLARLAAPGIFVITGNGQAASIIEWLNKFCGGIIADYGIYRDAADATSTILNLLARNNLPPAAAVMVGADIAGENCAQTAKLAKFIQAGAYFAGR